MNIVLFDNLERVNFIPRGNRECDHILNVLKLSAGDVFRAGVWGVSKGDCRILEVNGDGISFEYEAKDTPGEKLPLVLLISEIRPICMRRVLRFAGECGLSSMIITATELGDGNYMKSGLYTTGEYLKFLRDGSEISADSARPDIYFASSVGEAAAKAAELGADARFLLDKNATRMLAAPEDGALSAVAIGGERGFTARETEILAGSGFVPRLLGKRVLRSEEAAMLCVYPWLAR